MIVRKIVAAMLVTALVHVPSQAVHAEVPVPLVVADGHLCLRRQTQYPVRVGRYLAQSRNRRGGVRGRQTGFADFQRNDDSSGAAAEAGHGRH